MTRKRRRHSADQIVKKIRDADAMLAAGKSVGEVLQLLEISEATLSRWRTQYGGMKSEEAKRLKQLEDENQRLKKLVADQALDIQMLERLRGETNQFRVTTSRSRATANEVLGIRASCLSSDRSPPIDTKIRGAAQG